MRLGEIGAGPLFEAPGPQSKRVLRRIRGVVLEVLGFIVVTALLPLLLLGALIVDLYLKITTGKPMVGIRLVLFLWWFFLNEMWTLPALFGVWLATGGPFGKGSMRRRRMIYYLRPAWLGAQFAAFRVLFGLKYEIEGADVASPGPVIVMIRHASIIDNTLPDLQLARLNGMGIRYVIKRELEMIPLIDIGGRWVTTNFLQRGSGDADSEIAKLRQLAHQVGPSEAVLIYPEGTRATAKKIARAQEIIREKQPDVAPLSDKLVNLLPPRLGGPLALLEEGADMDVVFFAHVGFDGYEYISDIWGGGLVGATIKMKLWRVPSAEIPRDQGERAVTEWLYEHWHEMDRWVTEHLPQLERGTATVKSVGAVR